MSSMTVGTRSHSRPPGRLFVLLVLAVLAGVMGMHGLPPGTVVTHSGSGHERAMAAVDGVPHADGGCAHTDGGSGHLDHADGTCAAASTASGYTPPALVGAVLDAPAASVPVTAVLDSAHDGRAPPDLFQLQLLRI